MYIANAYLILFIGEHIMSSFEQKITRRYVRRVARPLRNKTIKFRVTEQEYNAFQALPRGERSTRLRGLFVYIMDFVNKTNQ